MKRWLFHKSFNRPMHVGSANGISLTWGWTNPGRVYKSVYILSLAFKFRFREWSIGLSRIEE